MRAEVASRVEVGHLTLTVYDFVDGSGNLPDYDVEIVMLRLWV